MLITYLVELLFLSLGIFNKGKKISFDIHTNNGRKKKEQQHLFVYRIILIVYIYTERASIRYMSILMNWYTTQEKEVIDFVG